MFSEAVIMEAFADTEPKPEDAEEVKRFKDLMRKNGIPVWSLARSG
jgi:hypothetical protein